MIYLGKIKKFNNIYHEQNIFIACRERKSRKQMYTNIYISLCSSAAHPATSYFIQPYTTFLYKSPTPCYVPSPRWMLNSAHVKELTGWTTAANNLYSVSRKKVKVTWTMLAHTRRSMQCLFTGSRLIISVLVIVLYELQFIKDNTLNWEREQREAQCIMGKSPPTITRCWAEQKSPTLEEGFTGIIWITIM